MVMDYVRACYSTQCRFIQGSDHESTITWYPALPGAELFPGHHRFGSLNWQLGQEFVADPYGVGEVAGVPRPFRSGFGMLQPMGDNYDGRRPYFSTGQVQGAVGLVRTAEGFPIACAPSGPGSPCGGLQLGGHWVCPDAANPWEFLTLAYDGSSPWYIGDIGNVYWGRLQCLGSGPGAFLEFWHAPAPPVATYLVSPVPGSGSSLYAQASSIPPGGTWPDSFYLTWIPD